MPRSLCVLGTEKGGFQTSSTLCVCVCVCVCVFVCVYVCTCVCVCVCKKIPTISKITERLGGFNEREHAINKGKEGRSDGYET